MSTSKPLRTFRGRQKILTHTGNREVGTNIRRTKLPLRHIGGERVQLHSFLTLALDVSGQYLDPAALPQRNNPGNHQMVVLVGPKILYGCFQQDTISCPCLDMNPRRSNPYPSHYINLATNNTAESLSNHFHFVFLNTLINSERWYVVHFQIDYYTYP